MRFRTTFWLLVSVCLAGSLVWFLNRYDERADGQAARVGSVDIAPERVVYLAVENGPLFLECQKRRGRWFITKPIEAGADGGRIEQVLDALARMPHSEVITTAQMRARRLTLADYELVSPRARVVVGDAERRQEVRIGCDAPFENRMYVQLGGESDVISTSTNLLSCLPSTVAEVRDRSVMRGEPARVTRFEIERQEGGFVQLLKVGEQWLLQQPLAARADQAKVLGLLNLLYRLRVQEFVADAKSDPVAYGLNPEGAPLRVTVWSSGDDAGTRLFFARRTEDGKEKTFARRADGSAIYAVSDDVLGVFGFKVSELRDRNVFTLAAGDIDGVGILAGEQKLWIRKQEGEWAITDPVQWRADADRVRSVLEGLASLQIARFVDGETTNLVSLGLEPPTCVVQVLSGVVSTNGAVEAVRGGAAGQTNEALCLGAPLAEGSLVYARLGGERTAFLVPASAVARFLGGARATDPLPYRDRVMLDIKPEAVRSVTLVRGERQQVAERDATGWKAVAPAGGKLEPAVIAELLGAVKTLRALSVVSQDPRGAAFGLDAPAARLTFGLRGEEGIQKTLLLGKPTPDGHVYAAVQGLDLVFVLDRAVAAALVRDFVPQS